MPPYVSNWSNLSGRREDLVLYVTTSVMQTPLRPLPGIQVGQNVILHTSEAI
jgi:hypothetical protein